MISAAHYRISMAVKKGPQPEIYMTNNNNDAGFTVGALLAAGRTSLASCTDSGRLDAELLLQLATGADRATLYANPERQVAASVAAKYQQYIDERARGRPLAYLTGEREFWSLSFRVDRHTLIPRPETELLVERTLAHIPEHESHRLLELGTGSGAIAAAIACERPACEIVATDVAADTLAMAARNFAGLCPQRIRMACGNWFAALDDAQGKPVFHVIVSNPPYIARNTEVPTDRELEFEPPDALYSGPDGLDAIRMIVSEAPEYLKPGGWLLLEHGFDQAAAVAGLMETAGFSAICCAKDLAGLPRVTEGQLTP